MQASWVIGSSRRSKDDQVDACRAWAWQTALTSGRARCTAVCSSRPTGLTMPLPRTTWPCGSTWTRCETLIWCIAIPTGLTQKWSCSSGSRRVTCPSSPSEKPRRPKMRQVAARRCSECARSASLLSKRGGARVAKFCTPICTVALLGVAEARTLLRRQRRAKRCKIRCAHHPRSPVMTASLTPAAELAKQAKTPFPGASADYESARQALLAEEIEFRRHMTRLAEQRRALPPGPVIEQGLPLQGRAGASRSACSTCSATRTRWSPTSGCTARSASGPARCAPTGSAR